MSNKYLGTEAGLIGPVEMEKPVKDISEASIFYWEKMDKYLLHLSSLPVLPCEGWKPEAGREYTEGVDIKVTNEYECTLLHLATHFHEIMFGGGAFSNPKAEYWYHKNTRRYYWEIGDVRQDGTYPCYGRKDDIIDQDEIVVVKYLLPVAVSLPAAQPSPELDHPEEKPINWKEQIADWFNKMSYASNVPVDTIIDYIDRIILQPAPAAPQEGETDLQKFLIREKGTISKIKQSDLKPGDKFVWFGSNGYELYSFRCDRGYGIGTNEGLIVNWSGLCGLFTPAPLPAANDGGDGLNYQKQIQNPYPSSSQSYTAFEKGFIQGYNTAKQSPTYPAEFVEWASNSGWSFVPIMNYWQHAIHKKQITTAELFTEWKRIKEQSK